MKRAERDGQAGHRLEQQSGHRHPSHNRRPSGARIAEIHDLTLRILRLPAIFFDSKFRPLAGL
jgi:hypothetical protein